MLKTEILKCNGGYVPVTYKHKKNMPVIKDEKPLVNKPSNIQIRDYWYALEESHYVFEM